MEEKLTDKKRKINLSLEPELYEVVKTCAKKDRRSVSNYVVCLLEDELMRNENRAEE